MAVQRFDFIEIKATKTPEGFIQDSPVIGRVGILEYRQPDGSKRYEFRPPEEAFHADSLASLKGKPVTVGHPGLVSADNVSKVKPIGTVLTEGKSDGDNIRADMVIYNLDTKNRYLSCGYTLDTEETPGEWQGQRYDAIQRNIRYNHVAVVQGARAGPVARLNMDGSQDYEDESEGKNTMAKINLDGIDYEAAPEVINALNKANKRADDAEVENKDVQKRLDTVTAERDGLQAKADGHAAELQQVRKDASDNITAAVKTRVELLQTAEAFRVDKADEMTDKDIKIAVIKAVRGDSFDPAGKSDDYIAAAFDLAKADKRNDGIVTQRQQINQFKKPDGRTDEGPKSAEEARQAMIERQQNAYKGTEGGK